MGVPRVSLRALVSHTPPCCCCRKRPPDSVGKGSMTCWWVTPEPARTQDDAHGMQPVMLGAVVVPLPLLGHSTSGSGVPSQTVAVMSAIVTVGVVVVTETATHGVAVIESMTGEAVMATEAAIVIVTIVGTVVIAAMTESGHGMSDMTTVAESLRSAGDRGGMTRIGVAVCGVA